MIVYEAEISEFLDDVANEVIVDRLYNVYQEKIGRTSKNEIRSWDHSLQRMSNVLRDREIPKDAKAAIEFKIPNTGKRVDFIIAGNDGDSDHAVIIELKQWESVGKNDRLDAVVVETYLGGAKRQTTHPSYQAWSYAALIEDFNEEVRNRPIQLQLCAYLHNYLIEDNDPLTDAHYKEHIEKAPVFRKGEMEKLRQFIKTYIKYGNKNDVITSIENGRIKPSKSLQDSMAAMLQGNPEFVMIMDYDIQVIDSPNVLREMIKEKNAINNKARLVAGYCWEWIKEGKNSSDIHDIVIEEHDFSISWNLGNDIWAIAEELVDEAGCIHTCQGLEFDYVGVIIGDDLRFENDQIITDYTK